MNKSIFFIPEIEFISITVCISISQNGFCRVKLNVNIAKLRYFCDKSNHMRNLRNPDGAR